MQSIAELIAGSETFEGMAREHLELIAGCAHVERVAAGTVLLREGEPADRFFLIRRGRVALELHPPGRGPLVVQTLHEGEVLGWSWLFAPYRWSLDARALEDGSVLSFDGVCLRGKAEADHELGYELMKRFAANLIARLQDTRMQLIDVYGHGPASA